MRFLIILVVCSSLIMSCNGGQQKNKPALTDTLIRARFVALEFMADDKPSIALIDGRYKDFAHKEKFPLSVFITVTTVEKNEKGHPTAAESKVFNAIEDSVINGLRGFTTCYIAKTTMSGYRDVIFYVAEKDREAISAVLAGIKKKFPRIKSYVFEKDPNWEAVSEFYQALGKVKQ